MTMKRPYRPNGFRRWTLMGLGSIGFASCADTGAVREAKQPVKIDVQTSRMDRMPMAAEPGAEHERLQALVGEWKAETRAWLHPGATVQEGQGTVSNFWMLNGRFVGQEYKSRAQRPKYEGLGALGYDNTKKVYTSVWLDTTSTSIYTATGSCDESGNVFTLEGVCHDPVTGEPVKCKSVTRIVNRKEYTFELFKEGSDGKVFRALDITYTRK